MLQDGRKRIETRAATKKYQNIKTGEMLTFSCDGERFEKEVSKITHFASIGALFKIYKPTDINPTIKTKDDLIKKWYSFPGYDEKIKEFGIIAIEFVK
jgi:ASC-1-like (ASCH) protein